MIHAFKDMRGRTQVDVDAVVVGSGAGGAVVAARLAAAGKKVALIEEGPYIQPEEFSTDSWVAMRQLYRDNGMRAMIGKMIIPTMQARVVGGTTVVNSAICYRIPDEVLDEWVRDECLRDLSPTSLAPYYDELEKFLNITEEPDQYLGQNNILLRKACAELGWQGEAIRRNSRGCKGCGTCMSGCVEGAKMSMDRSYVPAMLESGGELFTDCRVEKVLAASGRAEGISGTLIDPLTKKPSDKTLEVRAKVVVISCGAIGTPVLLLKNGLANSSGLVGRNLLNHTATGMLGVFGEDVCAWNGVNEGYSCSHFRRQGFMVEVAWAPPDVIGIRVPGFGLTHKNMMARLRNMAMWGTMIRGRTRGRVFASKKSWSPTIIYNMTREDGRTMQRGMKAIADLFFAAGAQFVLPGLNKVAGRISRPADTRSILETDLRPTDFSPIGNHPMGTCRMSADPKKGVVDSWGQSHDVRGLYVADGSIFPAAPGVNPMETIMALSARIADGIKQQL